MNAAIRAVVRTAIFNKLEVVGIKQGYEGLINGDFETGDLSSWDPINNGGTISPVNSTDSGSEWFVNIKAGAGNSPFISQNGLGVETIFPGDPICLFRYVWRHGRN